MSRLVFTLGKNNSRLATASGTASMQPKTKRAKNP